MNGLMSAGEAAGTERHLPGVAPALGRQYDSVVKLQRNRERKWRRNAESGEILAALQKGKKADEGRLPCLQ
jgi:hypothetical protein